MRADWQLVLVVESKAEHFFCLTRLASALQKPAWFDVTIDPRSSGSLLINTDARVFSDCTHTFFELVKRQEDGARVCGWSEALMA